MQSPSLAEVKDPDILSREHLMQNYQEGAEILQCCAFSVDIRAEIFFYM